MTRATIHIDGGSRGNPGPASYAVVIARPGEPTIEESQAIGSTTNNVAEYSALVRALELATELGIAEADLYSDSELLVKQMRGEYRVKSADLQELFQEASHLRKNIRELNLQHVRRELNKRADFLCNEALDGRPRRAGEAVPEVVPAAKSEQKKSATKKEPKQFVGDHAVRDDALECLQAAARAWADHGPENPPVAQVWEQLWFLLEEANVLKKK